MAAQLQQEWISSKKILDVTGISRATLNNYIRLGLLPRPILDRPRDEVGGPKRIGYFPPSALDRIQNIKQYKKEGHSIGQIVDLLKGLSREAAGSTRPSTAHSEQAVGERFGAFSRLEGPVETSALRVTFDEDRFPAYFMNRQLRMLWANSLAAAKIFRQRFVGGVAQGEAHIFKLLFHWEIHDFVLNWKDLVRFHIAYAKNFVSESDINLLYDGITETEAQVLRELWGNVPALEDLVVQVTQIHFLKHDGSTDAYQVHSVPFREGLLFVLMPVIAC